MSMERTDTILENFQKEVQIAGRSGLDSIYLVNPSFTIKAEEFSCPINSDLDGASADFLWFLECAGAGMSVAHPAPDKSFWRRLWGKDALPYGASWRFETLLRALKDPEKWRRAILYNSSSQESPPCIVCYQFLRRNKQLDCIVTMRSSDVVKVLPQDTLMVWMLLRHVCNLAELEIGDITFNIGVAHYYWEDLERHEFDIDFPN